MPKLDAKTIDKLEAKLSQAIASCVLEMGLKRLPLLPNQDILHLMAKAAVTAYEAADANQREDAE